MLPVGNRLFLYIKAFQRMDVRYWSFIDVLMRSVNAKNTKLLYILKHHDDDSEKGGTFLGVWAKETPSFLP